MRAERSIGGYQVSAAVSDGRGAVRRRARWRGVTALCWILAGSLGLLSLAWTMSGQAWLIDMAANLNAQWLLGVPPVVLVCLVLGRRGAAGVAAAGGVMLALPLFMDRAAIWPANAPIPRPSQFDSAPAGTGADPAGASTVVRVLHYNGRSLGRHDDQVRLMEETDADVISIVGPNLDGQVSVIYGRGLEDRYPGKLVRAWQAGGAADGAQMISPAYLVSRWSITPMDLSFLAGEAEHVLAGVVERPSGRFGVVAVHPRSPRTKHRWARGNVTVEGAIEACRRLEGLGLPVLLISDLNSTPSGHRCRLVASGTGFRRAKPVFELAGTYPKGIPLGLNLRSARNVWAAWPAMIAIDDVWISRGVEVVGWSVLGWRESEHRPILVDLEVPNTGGGGGAKNVPTK